MKIRLLSNEKVRLLRNLQTKMKYIFRGKTLFEYRPNEADKVIMPAIHDQVPAWWYCTMVDEDYKLLSEFFDKVYRHTQGEQVELKDIKVN